MTKSLLIACIALVLLFSGCSPQVNPSPTQPPTLTAPADTPSPTPSLTPTRTPSPSPTATSTPADTPTPRPTSTPAAISPANAASLQKTASYELPVRGELWDARWSQDGELVLVQTDLGTSLLSADSLEQVHFFPGMVPATELGGGKWLVRFEGKPWYLHLEGSEYRLLPVEERLASLGTEVVALNGETAARPAGEMEIEIVSLLTGDRQVFNIEAAGYYPKFIRPAALSPDGSLLVIQDTYWGDFYFINLETSEVVYQLSNTYDDPSFSPDGQYVMVTDNGGIKLLKANNGIQTNRFSDGFLIRPTSQTYIYYQARAYAYHPDGQHMGVVYCVEAQPCELYLWSIATGQPETIIKGLPAWVRGLDFSPGGDAFLTVSDDGIVNTWSLESQAVLAESQPYDRARPALSLDGRLAAIPRGSHIEIIDVASGELVQQIGDYPGMNGLMVDALTAQTLLVSGYGYYRGSFSDVWDLASGSLVRQFAPQDIRCELAAGGQRIACGADPLQIYDLQTGALLYSRKSPEGDHLWALSPDGNTLASCTVVRDPETYESTPGDRIFLLDLAANSTGISGVLESPQGGICSPMVFSPDSQFLAAQSGYLWNLDEEQPLASFPAMADAPLLFIAEGSVLVSGSRLIQANSGEVLAELAVDGEVRSIGFDPQGYRLVLGTDRGIEVWKVSGD